jgi:hypothetical protein
MYSVCMYNTYMYDVHKSTYIQIYTCMYMYTYLYSGEGFIFCVVVRFTPWEYQSSVTKKKIE